MLVYTTILRSTSQKNNVYLFMSHFSPLSENPLGKQNVPCKSNEIRSQETKGKGNNWFKPRWGWRFCNTPLTPKKVSPRQRPRFFFFFKTSLFIAFTTLSTLFFPSFALLSVWISYVLVYDGKPTWFLEMCHRYSMKNIFDVPLFLFLFPSRHSLLSNVTLNHLRVLKKKKIKINKKKYSSSWPFDP